MKFRSRWLAAVLLLLGGAIWGVALSPHRPTPPALSVAAESKWRQLVAERSAGQRPRHDLPGQAQAFARAKRLGDPHGTALAEQGLDPPALYAWARRQMEGLPRYSTRLGRTVSRLEIEALAAASHTDPGPAPSFATWEPLGPGNIGGRTRALLVDPDDPRGMIAGGVSGGVRESEANVVRPLRQTVEIPGVGALLRRARLHLKRPHACHPSAARPEDRGAVPADAPAGAT